MKACESVPHHSPELVAVVTGRGLVVSAFASAVGLVAGLAGGSERLLGKTSNCLALDWASRWARRWVSWNAVAFLCLAALCTHVLIDSKRDLDGLYKDEILHIVWLVNTYLKIKK